MVLSQILRRNWLGFLYLSLICADFVLFFKLCLPASEINQFFVRDILRTQEILSGHFISVGPDFTSGTYAPGPFYYFILAPIVFFTQKAEFIVIYLFALKTVIQLFFSRSLEKLFSISSVYFYLLLSASPIVMRGFYWPNNAALIIPLGQLLCLFAIWYYQAASKKQLVPLIVMSTFWGLSLQVHFSLFLAGPLLFLLIGERNESARDRLKDTGIFFLCAFISLIPFLTAADPIFYARDFGFSYFFKNWGLQVGRTFTSIPQVDRFHIFYWSIFFYTLIKGAWILFSKKVIERSFYERIFLSLTFLTLSMSAWILSGKTMRYYSLLYSLSYLVLALEIHRILIHFFKNSKIKFYFAGMAFVLSWFSLFSFYKDLGLNARCENCILQMQKICDYMNTNKVSYQEFTNSTYELLEEFNEGSAALSEDCFQLKTGSASHGSKRYLIAHARYLNDATLTAALANFPVEIRDVYRKDRLHLELANEGFSLYSVEMAKSELEAYPRLTNLAYFYEIDPAFGENYWLSKFREKESRVSRSRICPAPIFCDVFIEEKLENGVLSLDLYSRIFQTKYDLDPVAARAQGLKLNYLCDGKMKSLDLVSTLGASNGMDQNLSYFTPLSAAFKVSCNTVQLVSFKFDTIDLFYTKTGLDHLKDQEYKISAIDYQLPQKRALGSLPQR